ncbi:hypothetical protein [Rhizobium sp. CNPSo 3490]|uniref:hypothetical protein n=1 Tax=Rhizobium sp. CNPSo 3490 TaxID=3021407 RepID=UPI00254EE142|nr:hypothetical protein [Rhizobium sp. CNPSo 3490]MDK4736870.1 hypothetical protein [Rhizobium sp. CNPSo 3490]
MGNEAKDEVQDIFTSSRDIYNGYVTRTTFALGLLSNQIGYQLSTVGEKFPDLNSRAVQQKLSQFARLSREQDWDGIAKIARVGSAARSFATIASRIGPAAWTVTIGEGFADVASYNSSGRSTSVGDTIARTGGVAADILAGWAINAAPVAAAAFVGAAPLTMLVVGGVAVGAAAVYGFGAGSWVRDNVTKLIQEYTHDFKPYEPSDMRAKISDFSTTATSSNVLGAVTPLPPVPTQTDLAAQPTPLSPPDPVTSVAPLTPASLPDFRNDWNSSSNSGGGQYSGSSGRGGSADIYGSSSWGGHDSRSKSRERDGSHSTLVINFSGGHVESYTVKVDAYGNKTVTPDKTGVGLSFAKEFKGNFQKEVKNYSDSWGQRSPVLLDLSGNGLSVETMSSSSKFIDLDGDGYQHRTAWAGAGTGVLVVDSDGDGKISRSSEFAFTEWDSSATSDLEALKHVFDTNSNGKLDAGDAQWSKFRVEVNGQLVTLDSLGITSIDLTPKGSGQTFEDGSAITGTTTFTRTDGTTGAVGDATLANDEAAFVVKTSSATKADSSVEKTILAYNKDGSLAFRNVVTTSADGKSVQTQFDDDGNGTFDRSQTNSLTVDASGVQTKTVSNFNADGSLSDRTTTVTSADHLTVTTSLDQDGDSIADQRQTFVKSDDGSTTTTTQQLSINGTVLFGTAVTGSADGVTKTTSLDRDGNGVYDDVVTETTTVAADGSRTKTVIDRSSNGKLLSEVDMSTSADGRTITVTVDADGNGPRETKTVTTSTVAASGDVTQDTIVYNTNASFTKRSKSTTVTTANGLSKTTTSDVNADGVIDFTDTDVTVIDATNRTQTVQHRTKTGTTGTLLSQTVTKTSLDGKSITITEDGNGDTKTDKLTEIVVGTDGKTTNTVSALNTDGSTVSKTITVTTTDGLSKTISVDANGDTVNDLVVSDVTTTNSDGSRTETVTSTSTNGTLIGKTVTTTSSNSLTQTVKTDANGDGVFEDTTKSVVVLDSTGKRTETVRSTSADGTLKTQIVTDVSADRRNTTIVTDADGDGRTDTRRVESVSASGNVNIWERQYAADASTISTTITDISGNGLTKAVSADLNHDGVGDRITSDTTVLNADGSKTQTISLTSSDATRLNKKMVVTSGNGMSITTSEYFNADEVVDAKTTDVTTFDTYGLQFQTVSNYRGTSLIGSTKVTTNLNGLSGSTDYDLDGNGTINQTLSWKKTPLDPLGSVTTTETVRAADANTTLLSQKITTVSADKKTTTISSKMMPTPLWTFWRRSSSTMPERVRTRSSSMLPPARSRARPSLSFRMTGCRSPLVPTSTATASSNSSPPM